MANYFIKINEKFLLSDIKDKEYLKILEDPKFKKPIVDRFKEFKYDSFDIGISSDLDSILTSGPNKGKTILSGPSYTIGPAQKTKGAIISISPNGKDIEVIIDGIFKLSVKSHHEKYINNCKFVTYYGIYFPGNKNESSLHGEITSGTLEKPSKQDQKKYIIEDVKHFMMSYRISSNKDDLK
jgi:hypothetical protein